MARGGGGGKAGGGRAAERAAFERPSVRRAPAPEPDRPRRFGVMVVGGRRCPPGCKCSCHKRSKD